MQMNSLIHTKMDCFYLDILTASFDTFMFFYYYYSCYNLVLRIVCLTLSSEVNITEEKSQYYPYQKGTFFLSMIDRQK
jgi:hypothetical protein